MDMLDQYSQACLRTVRRVGIIRLRCRKYLSSPHTGPSRAQHAAPLKVEYGAGEFALLWARFHDGWQNYNFHAERGNRGGLRSIGWIDHEGAGEIGVEFGYA